MMAMLSNVARSHRLPALAKGLGCVAMAGAAVAVVGLSSTDRVLETSFSMAMAEPAKATGAVYTASRPANPISGSEDYWLGGLPNGASPAAWSSPLAVGDRFAIGTPGAERPFTVVDVHETTVAVGAHGMATRLLLVECRDERLGQTAPVVRVIMDDALAASLKAGSALPRTL